MIPFFQESGFDPVVTQHFTVQFNPGNRFIGSGKYEYRIDADVCEISGATSVPFPDIR